MIGGLLYDIGRNWSLGRQTKAKYDHVARVLVSVLDKPEETKYKDPLLHGEPYLSHRNPVLSLSLFFTLDFFVGVREILDNIEEEWDTSEVIL